MNPKCLIKYVISSLVFTIFVSCTESVDSLTDNYNSAFKPVSSETELPGDSNSIVENYTSIYDALFDQNSMLANSYIVRDFCTFCLIGPSDAERYEWTAIAVKGSGCEGAADSLTLGEGQQLSLYVPRSSLKVWTEYALTLTVYAEDGSKYTDTAILWVVPA